MFTPSTTHHHKIIDDFVNSHAGQDGFGYFEEDLEAITYAKKMGRNQERRWRRYGIVPKALIEMMTNYLACGGKANPLYRDISYGDFLTLLMRGPYKDEAGRQVCEKLYRDLIITEFPWLRRSFMSNDNFYNWHEKQPPSKRGSKNNIKGQ